MPSIRIGFSTDFVLVNEQVGINTTNPTALLDVRGQIRADRTTGSGGITTLTTYDGFLQSRQIVGTNISIASTTKGNLNSISGEIIVDGEVTVSSGTPLTGGRLDSLTVTGTFDLPSGGSANREVTPEKGSTRFNQDLGQLEFYTGYEWRTVSSYDGSSRGRAVIGDNSTSHVMDFVNIQSLGNALNFGTLSDSRASAYACSSSTRGLWGGGATPTVSNVIDYITIASEGNAIDFGDLLSNTAQEPTSCSSSTRGIWAGGYTPTPAVGTRINVIQYVSISTIGNALDFGDLTSLGASIGSLASSTRGVFGGGYRTSPGLINTIDFITIASTGNAISFGTLSEGSGRLAGCSNGTRGVFAGGRAYPSSPGPSSFTTSRIDYITVASTGNAIRFGDLTSSNRNMLAAAANSTRGIFAGGYSPTTNVIDYITFTSTGNAIDFGDLTKAKRGVSACSDSHGGLGGF